MNLVVNEWLLEYFVPGTPRSHQNELLEFFDCIQKCRHKIVVGRETPFAQKFYKFMKQYGHDSAFKHNYAMLNGILFRDTERTILVERNNTTPVPDEHMISVHSDDRYLLELVNSVPESMIISTDGRLIEALSQHPEYPIVHLQDYIKQVRDTGCK
jgi:hypothetical protein